MRNIVNGRIVELPTDPDGSIREDLLRRAAGIAADRALIVQMPDGSNRVVNQGERLPVTDDQSFLDAPKHKRGGDPEDVGTEGYVPYEIHGGCFTRLNFERKEVVCE